MCGFLANLNEDNSGRIHLLKFKKKYLVDRIFHMHQKWSWGIQKNTKIIFKLDQMAIK